MQTFKNAIYLFFITYKKEKKIIPLIQMFEDYENMSEKTKTYFEKARREAAKEAFIEIRRNDFIHKAQYSSGFLVLPEIEFTKNLMVETMTLGIDLKASKSLVPYRYSKYDIYKSIESDAHSKKNDNTNSMYHFLNLEEGCDIMVGKSDGTVKYLVTIVGTPFFSTEFFFNGLNHRRYIANILEAPIELKLLKNISSKFNERFQKWDFD